MNSNELTPDNNDAVKLDQGHIVSRFLFKTNRKFSEAIEKSVRNPDSPAAGMKFWIAFQFFLRGSEYGVYNHALISFHRCL